MQTNLKKLNEQLIKKYEGDEELLKRQLLIQKMLRNPRCFFQIPIDVAFSILRDLEIEEKYVQSVYMELIDSKNF